MSYTLYGEPGFGSVCVEALLECLGLDYTLVRTNPLGDKQNRDRIQAVNPTGQVPALILPDGTMMTESAAMLILLADRHPASGLAPGVDAAERPAYLRWLTFLSSSVYSTFTLSDGPARFHPDVAQHPTMLEKAQDRRKAMLSLMDEAFAGHDQTYLLGSRMTALDIYMAMMSRWDPGRDWFDIHCPNLRSAVEATEAHPVIARVWARNFNQSGSA
jgi:GST-like protein